MELYVEDYEKVKNLSDQASRSPKQKGLRLAQPDDGEEMLPTEPFSRQAKQS
jgi:hypothetical protein